MQGRAEESEGVPRMGWLRTERQGPEGSSPQGVGWGLPGPGRGPDSRFRARSVPRLPPSTATLVSRPVLCIEFARGVDPGVSAPDAQRSMGRSGGAASWVVGTLSRCMPHADRGPLSSCPRYSRPNRSNFLSNFPALQDTQGPRLGTAESVRKPGPTISELLQWLPPAPTGLRHPHPRGTQAVALFGGRLTTDPWVLGSRFLSHVLRRTERGGDKVRRCRVVASSRLKQVGRCDGRGLSHGSKHSGGEVSRKARDVSQTRDRRPSK